MGKPCVITDDQQHATTTSTSRRKKHQTTSVSSNDEGSSSDYGSEDATSEINSPAQTLTDSASIQQSSPHIPEDSPVRRDSMEKSRAAKHQHQKSTSSTTTSNCGSICDLSSLGSTPKLKHTLMKSTERLIKEFSTPPPPAMEYSYYVIASPVVDRKITHNNRSYSFVSVTSSRDSSSSEISSVIQPKKRAPKSRGLLKSVKEQLLKEIENINMELVKMDSEKLILGNLRNASLLYRDMICQSERNNQGIPNAQKLRCIVESIELKITDEEIALNEELSIPHIDCVKKDMQDFIKICNLITNNKTNLKISMVEELLCAVGKLYGEVDTLLKIFYEHEDEFSKQEEDEEEMGIREETEECIEQQQADAMTNDNEDGGTSVEMQSSVGDIFNRSFTQCSK